MGRKKNRPLSPQVRPEAASGSTASARGRSSASDDAGKLSARPTSRSARFLPRGLFPAGRWASARIFERMLRDPTGRRSSWAWRDRSSAGMRQSRGPDRGEHGGRGRPTGAIISQDYYQVRGAALPRRTCRRTTRSCGTSISTGSTTPSSTRRKYWDTTSPLQVRDSLAPAILSSRAFLADLAEKARKDRGSILGAAPATACRSSSRVERSSIGHRLTEHYHGSASGPEPMHIPPSATTTS